MVTRRVADREPSCIDEKRAVERARRRVAVAERKVDAVRRWTAAIDRAADDFRRAAPNSPPGSTSTFRGRPPPWTR